MSRDTSALLHNPSEVHTSRECLNQNRPKCVEQTWCVKAYKSDGPSMDVSSLSCLRSFCCRRQCSFGTLLQCFCLDIHCCFTMCSLSVASDDDFFVIHFLSSESGATIGFSHSLWRRTCHHFHSTVAVSLVSFISSSFANDSLITSPRRSRRSVLCCVAFEAWTSPAAPLFPLCSLLLHDL